MSIGGQIKHAVHHAAHKVEHAAEDAAGKVKHEADKTADDVQDDVLDNIDDEVKAEIQKLIDPIVAEAKKGIDEFGGETRRAIQSFGDEVKKEVKAEGADIKNNLNSIKDDIESAVEAGVKEMTAEAIEQGIKGAHVVALAVEKAIARLEDKAPKIVDLLNSQSIPINLGPIVLTYTNGVSRIDDIADALGKVSGQDFKLTQAFINDLLHGLGPDTISIHADVEFFVEVGLDLDDIPFEARFVEIADILFDALGVPS